MAQVKQADLIRHLTEQVAVLIQKVDLLAEQVRNLDAGKGRPHVSSDVLNILHTMTPKQHVAMQMVLVGCSNREIAEQLGVTENTAKVHVRAITQKLGVNSRAKVVAKMVEAMAAIDREVYMEASGGIPPNWATTMRLQQPDPCAALYR